MESPIEARIGQVFVPVTDLPRAIAWYSRLFGLPVGAPSHGGTIYDLPMSGATGLTRQWRLCDRVPRVSRRKGLVPPVALGRFALESMR